MRGGGEGRGGGTIRAGILFAALAVGAGALTPAATGQVSDGPDGPLGLTTVDTRLLPDGDGTGFLGLRPGPGEGYIVREEGLGTAKAKRAKTRRSLAYLAQLSDFQLVDEESPARVESLDQIGSPFDAAWRPWEALQPQIGDSMIRQINAFADVGPVRAAKNRRVGMDFAIDTGDSADSQQLNEATWVRTLLDGGRLDPNSGIDPTGYLSPSCPPVGVPGAAEAARYTGVQDYDDYAIPGSGDPFYDPDDVQGTFADFPSYPGLMDQAQVPFDAAGLAVPSYVSFGNHDALVQGNQAATGAFEQIATGCAKPTGPVGLVPPDPKRRFVSKREYMDLFRESPQADGHGFDNVDAEVRKASGGNAGYYSFSPVEGVRMIALDTVSEGGVIGPSADGNIDDPQFRWLEGELEEATRNSERVILFSHHAIPSLTSDIPDEATGPCTAADSHGHDVNPGCDADPRSSTPIHLADDTTELLLSYPNVIAWVAGHSHVNDVQPYVDESGKGNGFWMIRTASEADWPQQARLVQLFDNRDGTLSIFGTVIDHASPIAAPPDGSNAAGMSRAQLASIGRTLSYNDNQKGARECDPACGEGDADDRNVELLIDDPLRPCATRIPGGGKRDVLKGTPAPETLLGRAGNDVIKGKGGGDCAQGGPGGDKIVGGSGRDVLRGGGRNDRIYATDGEVDRIDCGPGADTVRMDKKDKARHCEYRRITG